eukprot:UN05317
MDNEKPDPHLYQESPQNYKSTYFQITYLRFTHKYYLDPKYIIMSYYNVLLSQTIEKKRNKVELWCGSLKFENHSISS